MTKKKKDERNWFIAMYIFLLLLVFVLLAMNICIGSVNIPLKDVMDIFHLSHGAEESIYKDIVMDIRFPRALAAAVLGGALALSGYLLQTFFHNPIAGPFILGISSGAKLFVAMIMVFALGIGMKITSVTMILGSFLGAMISMGFVLFMSKIMKNMSMLIVSGIMIGYICSALTDLVVTFANDSDIVNLHDWSKGSFSGISWSNVWVMSFVIGVTVLFVFFMSKPISAYQLGESYARNMGVNIPVFRALLVLLSSVLSASVTAFAGPVSFVGIAVPHLVKNLLKTTKPIIMIPACFLGGSAFCLFCDLLARTLFNPTELSISTVTAIFGAPVVIYIMIRRKNSRD